MIDDEYPSRKWLDKKQYVRVDHVTGLPQLIRVEPMVTSDGRFIFDQVQVFVDNESTVMDREMAEDFIEDSDCVPIEHTAQWKQGNNG